MANFPSGTVTFLFTDIEGSTRLAQQYPNAMPALLARHDEILNHAVQLHEGYIFETAGDAFYAAFSSALDALNAALEAQQLLYHEPWSPAPLKVRMGIHTGLARVGNDGKYSGYTTLAFAQRITSAGHGGQILLSSTTYELLRDFLPPQCELQALGERRLQDLLRPERLYQVNRLGFPITFPPLKTLDLYPNNFPVQLTSFIGREKEIDDVKREMAEHRLVTLTGPGGTGKTRLSLQVAAELLDRFPHGIWFVELAPLSESELIPQTILSAIGISEQAGVPPIELLQDYLREKTCLIILDNCEHLIEASAAIVSSLLSVISDLKILASSREILGVNGEACYPVPSLELPDIKHLPVVDQLSQYEAVRLFIDRVLLVSPNFVVDNENAPFIAQICYRLDGIPLAIELAAARVKMMSVEQICRRLDDRFRLLTGGSRTALPRQQTLGALIDWSYDLLSENERRLLCRLSVFVDGCSLDAVEDTCTENGIGPYEVLDLLAQLVNKSLVTVVEGSYTQEMRYHMLETIRQYALGKLLKSGEDDVIREKYFDYYLHMTRQAETEYFGPREIYWLTWLENEWDNLRAAVEWSLEKRPMAGLELVNYLGHFLSDNWHVNDLESWLSQFIPHPANAARTRTRACGLSYWAQSINIGPSRVDVSSPDALMDEAFSIYQELGDESGMANCILQKGHFYFWKGEPYKGSPLLEEALLLFRQMDDKPWIATALHLLGFTELNIPYMQESLTLYRDLGYVSGTIEVLKQLGAVALRLGHFDLAHTWLDEALMLLQQHASTVGKSKTVSYDVGDLAFYEGNYELARKYYEDCLAWAERVVSSVSIGFARVRLGYLYLRCGELQKAAQFFREALDLFLKSENLYGINFTLTGFASLSVAEQRWEKAGNLFFYLEKQFDPPRPPVEQAPVDRDLAVIRVHLADDDFAKLSAEGNKMTMEQAIALALEE
jgi:predicted ATPase/class 3 adenylate cyclase/tetratricopeptide (TPR) repeat protein